MSKEAVNMHNALKKMWLALFIFFSIIGISFAITDGGIIEGSFSIGNAAPNPPTAYDIRKGPDPR